MSARAAGLGGVLVIAGLTLSPGWTAGAIVLAGLIYWVRR